MLFLCVLCVGISALNREFRLFCQPLNQLNCRKLQIERQLSALWPPAFLPLAHSLRLTACHAWEKYTFPESIFNSAPLGLGISECVM